jgi:predicted nuclease of restriction endonuclease-like RecB superfamily
VNPRLRELKINADDIRNSFERDLYKQLRARQRKDYEISYESERLHYAVPQEYVPDFVVSFPSGRKIYIEGKGYFRPEDRRKLVAVRNSNPEIDLRIVFQRDQKLSKHHKMTYGQWADREGFPWAVGSIPKEWLKDG